MKLALYFIAGMLFGLTLAMLREPAPALAQIAPGSGVQVSGAVTVGHCVKFLSRSVIADSGGVC